VDYKLILTASLPVEFSTSKKDKLLLSRLNGDESRDKWCTGQSLIKCFQNGLSILPGS
jgi:hypothetical protein